ncbi:hypothetical protein ACQ4WP_23730 [Janthinobacterium sp. GB4P2]|uniref:hypothetical protein n=1 Tax=Janthinobacterium sp. GB4P2 TaxID=3424189 RepID=UPI003F211018
MTAPLLTTSKLVLGSAIVCALLGGCNKHSDTSTTATPATTAPATPGTTPGMTPDTTNPDGTTTPPPTTPHNGTTPGTGTGTTSPPRNS